MHFGQYKKSVEYWYHPLGGSMLNEMADLLTSPPPGPAVRPNLYSVNTLVIPLLTKPTRHRPQETAPVSSLCSSGTEWAWAEVAYTGIYGCWLPTFCCVETKSIYSERPHPQQNSLSLFSCVIIVVVSLQFSLQQGAEGGWLQSQHRFKGKTNQEECSTGRKWGVWVSSRLGWWYLSQYLNDTGSSLASIIKLL